MKKDYANMFLVTDTTNKLFGKVVLASDNGAHCVNAISPAGHKPSTSVRVFHCHRAPLSLIHKTKFGKLNKTVQRALIEAYLIHEYKFTWTWEDAALPGGELPDFSQTKEFVLRKGLCYQFDVPTPRELKIKALEKKIANLQKEIKELQGNGA